MAGVTLVAIGVNGVVEAVLVVGLAGVVEVASAVGAAGVVAPVVAVLGVSTTLDCVGADVGALTDESAVVEPADAGEVVVSLPPPEPPPHPASNSGNIAVNSSERFLRVVILVKSFPFACL